MTRKPNPTVKILRTVAKGGRRARERLDPVTQGVQAAIRTLSNPTLVLGMMLVAALVVSHTRDVTRGPVVQFGQLLSRKGQTRAVGDWIQTNATKAMTMAVYFVTAIVTAPASARLIWGAYGLVVGFLVPEPNGYEPIYQCMTLAAVMKTRSTPGRVVLIAIALAVYLVGFGESN